MKAKIINYFISVTLLLLLSYAAIGQIQQARKYPMPGDTIADHTFTDLVNYPNATAKISDFRGKWLILDFWALTCSSCIASFPRMNALSQQFKDKNVQLIMIAATASSQKNNAKMVETLTKKLYQRQDMLHHLKFTVAFDSTLCLKLNVSGLPHILVINPEGKIITKTLHVDSLQIAELLAGKLPKFERSYSRGEPVGEDSYNKKSPLLTNNGATANGGKDTDYIYRSMLVPYDKAIMPYYSDRDFTEKSLNTELSKPVKVELFGYKVETLFRLAYFGRSFWDQQDPAAYSLDYINILNETGNPIVNKQLQEKYAYSLSMPATDSIAPVMRTLQEDLKRVFPYQAKLETRSLPAYQITVANTSKLNRFLKDHKKGAQTNDFPYDGVWKVRNMDFDIFIKALIGSMHTDSPVFNRTGILEKFINVDFPSDKQSKESIINGMEQIGLKVELIQNPMRVLVLR